MLYETSRNFVNALTRLSRYCVTNIFYLFICLFYLILAFRHSEWFPWFFRFTTVPSSQRHTAMIFFSYAMTLSIINIETDQNYVTIQWTIPYVLLWKNFRWMYEQEKVKRRGLYNLFYTCRKLLHTSTNEKVAWAIMRLVLNVLYERKIYIKYNRHSGWADNPARLRNDSSGLTRLFLFDRSWPFSPTSPSCWRNCRAILASKQIPSGWEPPLMAPWTLFDAPRLFRSNEDSASPFEEPFIKRTQA